VAASQSVPYRDGRRVDGGRRDGLRDAKVQRSQREVAVARVMRVDAHIPAGHTVPRRQWGMGNGCYGGKGMRWGSGRSVVSRGHGDLGGVL
jgi:hypothetical protein